MSCQDIKNNPFLIERKREKFVKEGNLNEFLKLYKQRNLGIKDNNTGEFWDYLNQTSNFSKFKNPMANHRIKIVSRIIRKNKKILDIGFGPASIEEILNKRKKKVDLVGIDISPLSVESAKRKFKNWTFKVGNILSIPFGQNIFDYVLTLEILEHIKPFYLFKALDEIKRVLKKDGFLIVSVPLNENIEQMLLNGENPNSHLREYTPLILKTELTISNFEILIEKKLYAFHKNYSLKSFLTNNFLTNYRKPNNIILVARKK